MSDSPNLFAKAKVQLVLNNPFFGVLVCHLPTVPMDPNVMIAMGAPPTAMVDGKKIYYNEEWVKTLSDRQRMGLLCHEVLHPALQHLWRRGQRDPELWNKACVDESTLITMADGSRKAAILVKVGEMVDSPFGPVPVTGVQHSMRDEVLELDTHKGNQLCCTPDHEILTGKGYRYAQELGSANYTCFVDTRDGLISSGAHNNEVSEGHRGGDGAEGHSGLQSGRMAGAGKKSHDSETNESAWGVEMDLRGGGVLRRHRGRGRNDIVREEGQEGETLHSTACICEQHFLGSDAVPTEDRNVSGHRKEYVGETVLAVRGVGISVPRPSGAYLSVLGGEETALRDSYRSDPDQASARVARFSDSTHHHLVGRTPGFEQTGISISRRIRESRLVVDISTPVHCFIANGIVVHNCDYVVNAVIMGTKNTQGTGYELPAEPLYDPKYNGMAVEQVYHLLKEDEQKQKKQGKGKVMDGHMEKEVEGGGKGKGQGEGKGKGKDGSGAGDKGKDKGQGGGKGKEKGDKGKDKGEGEEEGQGEGQGKGEGEAPNVQQEGQGGEPDYDTDDLDGADGSLEETWKGLLTQAAMVAKSKGSLPGGMERLVDEATRPRVPWQQIIEMYINDVVRDDYDMLRQDRRFLMQGIYFPEMQSNACQVAVAVDTSGSIGQEELKKFVGEISGILRCRGVSKMRLIACDAAVTLDETILPTDPLPERFGGGGGTDFRPVFKLIQEQPEGLPPALIVYLTDMMGTFPERDIGIPTIWMAATSSGVPDEQIPQPPFGITVRYNLDEDTVGII
jgi:predicted metal-dependent peptidase